MTTGTRRTANRVEQRSGRRGQIWQEGESRKKDEGIEIKRWEAERLMGDLTAGCG